MPATRKVKASVSVFCKGDTVEVREANIRPWTGVVTAVKWSPVSGWWCEVTRDDSETWVITESDLTKGPEALEEGR